LVKNLPKRLWIPHDEEEEKQKEQEKKEPIASPIIDGRKFIGCGEDADYCASSPQA
jgi:hypothetical protein